MNTVIHLNDGIRLAGGVEVYLEQLQRLLPQFGWQSDWLGMERNGNCVRLHRHGHPAWSWVGTIAEFKAFLKNQLNACGGGGVHIHSISDSWLIRACFEVGPVIRTMHEPRMFCPGQGKFWSRSEAPCTKPFGLHCLFHAYKERCCNRHPQRLFAAIRNTQFEIGEASHRYAAVVANSNYLRNEAVKAGVPREKIQVLPCFAEDVGLGSLDARPDLPRILFAGRLSRTKGVHYLLQAFVAVLQQVPEVTLDIAGSGRDERYFLGLAEELGIARAVKFHGWCDRGRVAELIGRASVVAFPSIYPESFGIVGIEAMMQRKPVVAYDVGGVGDWLHHGETGFLIEARNIGAFSSALCVLLNNRELRERFSARAREVAMQEFSVAKHLNALTAIYERVADRRENRGNAE